MLASIFLTKVNYITFKVPQTHINRSWTIWGSYQPSLQIINDIRRLWTRDKCQNIEKVKKYNNGCYKPIVILGRDIWKLWTKLILFMKVKWRNHAIKEAMWETEVDIHKCYPHLFIESGYFWLIFIFYYKFLFENEWMFNWYIIY